MAAPEEAVGALPDDVLAAEAVEQTTAVGRLVTPAAALQREAAPAAANC